jgi:two-component system, sensor histidine kinase and response regulator
MTTILVIEDETLLREEILDTLHFEQYQVLGAPDGRAGLELARQHIPNLIICDIVMPELDGHGVLYELRHEVSTATIPFIFLTAKSDKSDLRAGMELGADDYLTKPFTREELLAAISTQLEKKATVTTLTEQKLDSFRDQILSALPHELRTPLVSILGFSELLMIDAGSMAAADITQIAKSIFNGATRLHHLIENYLLYIEIGFIARDPAWIEKLRNHETVSPAPVIKQCARAVAQRAGRESDLQLVLGEMGTLQMFNGYLEKIIDELLDNAFKFSKPGMSVRLTTSTDFKGTHIEISDHGRGFTPEQILQVGAYVQFDRKFYEQQGSGMGLIIAQQLVELHGGQLTIQSALGKGTVIRIELP